MQLQEGFLFDNRYNLKKLLGRGGFSEVWLAEDTKVGNEKRALKIYAPGQGLDNDGIQLFSREFQLVYNFNHNHLLRPSHFDVCDCSPFLVLPFCERGSAAKLIAKITEEDAWHFLHDVATGLAFLHEQELIHQDIKPDNILIDKTGRFLITDFGISSKARSTLRRSMGEAKTSMTVAYSPPERFSKKHLVIKASDIWSLGATLFELLEGDVPFLDILGGQAQRNGAEIPEITGYFSQELKEIVTLCLQLETWDRPTAVQLVEWTEEHFKGNELFIKEKKKQRGKAIISDTKPNSPNSKEAPRNVFVSLWLWGTALVNGILGFVYSLDSFLQFHFIEALYANIFILNTFATVWLLQRVKLGFWLFLVDVFLVAVLAIYDWWGFLIFAIAFVIVLYAILLIRKDGVPAWQGLRKTDLKRDKVSFIVFGSIFFASLIIIPLIGYLMDR